jgi:hypothetical protein
VQKKANAQLFWQSIETFIQATKSQHEMTVNLNEGERVITVPVQNANVAKCRFGVYQG